MLGSITKRAWVKANVFLSIILLAGAALPNDHA